jgi:hypothetical protein
VRSTHRVAVRRQTRNELVGGVGGRGGGAVALSRTFRSAADLGSVCDHFAMLEATLALATIVRTAEINSLADDFPLAVPFTAVAAAPILAHYARATKLLMSACTGHVSGKERRVSTSAFRPVGKPFPQRRSRPSPLRIRPRPGRSERPACVQGRGCTSTLGGSGDGSGRDVRRAMLNATPPTANTAPMPAAMIQGRLLRRCQRRASWSACGRFETTSCAAANSWARVSCAAAISRATLPWR